MTQTAHPRVFLSAEPLVPEAIADAVRQPGHGGNAIFIGTVRDEPHLREVTSLEYEVFHGLAVPEMQVICDEANQRFGADCAIAHRIGSVGVGEPAVVVAASAPGRRAAIDACAWAIDEMKQRVPIWKRQHFADGGTDWSKGA